MTQNTEQNVRTREDREQEIAIMLCKARGHDPFQMTYQTIEPGVMEPYGDAWCHYLPEAKAVLEWHEASARGAAEQRRKDAKERDRAISHLRQLVKSYRACGWFRTSKAISRTLKSAYGVHYGPGEWERELPDSIQSINMMGPGTVHALIADAAALEAEIASLKEAEQLSRADAEASKARAEKLKRVALDVLQVCQRSKMGPSDLGYVTNMIRAALTREGGV